VSWVSALLDGRLTGSGAIFSGQQNPLDQFAANTAATAQAAAAKIRADAEAQAKAAAGIVVKGAVNAASPGAVILTRDVQIAIAAAAVGVGVLLYKHKK
jgi:hypothetical protein